MKKSILLLIMFFVLFFSLASHVVAAKKYSSGAQCAYCGNYFVFGDTKPFDDCFDRVQACFKKSKRMPGQSVDACMCMAAVELSLKYNKWDLLQRNLAWLYGAAGAAAGVSLPGQGLINPDERDKLINGDGSFGDYIDQLGEFGGKWGEIAGGITHMVEDINDNPVGAIAGGAAAVLPEGNSQTTANFINAVSSLRGK